MRKLLRDTKGAVAIEYTVLLALSAAVCIGAFTAIGGDVTSIFTHLKSGLAALP